MIEFPSQADKDEYTKTGNTAIYLAGFENNGNGKGGCFNFILSDGRKTNQKCDYGDSFTTHMMPQGIQTQIRKV